MIFHATLHGQSERAKAHAAIDAAPDLARVTVDDPKRTRAQNDALWAALDDISDQLVWHGQTYSASDWKDYLVHALKRARWMPDEEGGMVPIGMSTSKLSYKDFSDLLDVVHEFGSRNGVSWTDPQSEQAA